MPQGRSFYEIVIKSKQDTPLFEVSRTYLSRDVDELIRKHISWSQGGWRSICDECCLSSSSENERDLCIFVFTFFLARTLSPRRSSFPSHSSQSNEMIGQSMQLIRMGSRNPSVQNSISLLGVRAMSSNTASFDLAGSFKVCFVNLISSIQPFFSFIISTIFSMYLIDSCLGKRSK